MVNKMSEKEYDVGYKDGFADGVKSITDNVKEQVYNRGYDEGHKVGYKEATEDMVHRLRSVGFALDPLLGKLEAAVRELNSIIDNP